MTIAEAEAYANRYRGCGTYIYSLTPEYWKQLMGVPIGMSIFNHIFGVRNEKGGLPEHITYKHFKSNP